jgi:hypothetical protein
MAITHPIKHAKNETALTIRCLLLMALEQD